MFFPIAVSFTGDHKAAGGSLTLLHAAHVAKLRLVFAVLTSAGARLQSVLLAYGPRAALWGTG